MFCTKCGNRMDEGARFCGKCGTASSGELFQQPEVIDSTACTPIIPPAATVAPSNSSVGTTVASPNSRTIPKCTVCGHIGEWKKEMLFHPIPFIIGAAIAFYDLSIMREGFITFLYLIIFIPYCIARIVKKKNRICVKCDSVESFTFIY